jgi:small subunit ribosomal protein S6
LLYEGGVVALFMADKQAIESEDTKEKVEARKALYELLVLIPNKYTEVEAPQLHKKVNELVIKNGGVIKKEINYGKRRLAYPIDHNHYGYYLLTHFEAEAPVIKELSKELAVQEELLRHLITLALPEGALPDDAGDLRQIEQVPVKPEEKSAPISKKKPSIADAKATDTEKKKMERGSVFDLEKELGVTAEEAAASLESEGKEKSKSDDSVDLAGLESKLDEIVGDISKDEDKK